MKGAVNLVSPGPVRNVDFARSLGMALHRPAIFAAPAFILRLAMGEMSDIVLESARVMPQTLQQHGHSFLHPDLDGALRAILG